MTRLPDRSEYLHGRVEREDNFPLLPLGHPLESMTPHSEASSMADPLPEPPEGSVEAAIWKLRRTPMAETGLDPDDAWR